MKEKHVEFVLIRRYKNTFKSAHKEHVTEINRVGGNVFIHFYIGKISYSNFCILIFLKSYIWKGTILFATRNILLHDKPGNKGIFVSFSFHFYFSAV